MADPFAGQLASLCRAHVTRCKWVFVPTHAVGRTLGERIALAGTNWLNLRFVTPLDVALRMGAPFLVERGIDPSEEGLGPALVMRLLLDLPGQGGYFRPLADQPTMAQALYGTLRELRMAGLKADDLKPEAFENRAKHAELRALLAAYEQYLAATGRGDIAMVYQEAMQHPDWCPIQPDDCWTELPDVVWAPLQRRLMEAMPGEWIKPSALEIPGVEVPRRLADPQAALRTRQTGPGPEQPHRVEPLREIDPLAFLIAVSKPLAGGCERGAPTPAAAPSPVPVLFGARRRRGCSQPGPATRVLKPLAVSPSAERRSPGADCVSLFHAGGREAEIEEVFRRVLASGAPLDQVEIACSSDEHVALAWEKALRHEWPVTLGPGIPATATRPGRALLGFCDWIETDFSAGHLRRLLHSGDMGLEKEDEGFSAGQAARILAKSEAGWGRETYRLSLAALRCNYEARAHDAEGSDDERAYAAEQAALTRLVLAWIEKLIAAIPLPGADGLVPVQPVVDAALAYLERSTARHSALDHRSAGALAEYVAELRALGSFFCPLSHGLRFIRERVQSLQVAPDRPRPGHLYICRLAQAGYSGRPNLFVAGLEEGRVFPAASEDPVLLDAERAAISSSLRRSSDRLDESVYGVLSRLATLGVGSWQLGVDRVSGPAPAVTFSYSCRDTREFRETHASWLMLQAYRLQQGDAALSYTHLKAALGEPVSWVPWSREAAASLGPWWLRSVVGTGQPGAAVVGRTFPGVARGAEAVAARASDRFTEFDGYVPEAGALLDPCRSGNAYSVTALEAAAGCPFRFFVERGLGVRPLDARERDKDVWLDPRTRGNELHAIYAALWRRCRDDGRRPDRKKDGAWLQKLARARLDELECEMPAATAEILARESAEFLADVELFLEGECEDRHSTPIAFEVPFGRPLGNDDEELGRAEPVEIALGGNVKLRIAGRVDRIDRVGPGAFEVLDYKTGGCWRENYAGTFRGGRLLQHALYGLAAMEILKARHEHPKVTGGTYYFSSRKGRQERIRIAAPSAQEIATVLADLREVIRTGAFVHAPDDGDCRFCDFGAACGSGVQAHAQAKLAADARLKAYGSLCAHD